MCYQQPSDLARAPQARALAPAEFDAFMNFHHTAFREGGAVPLKYRELTALALATLTKCAYCIDTHTRGAGQAGASAEEIAEIAFVAAAVGAGGPLAHGMLALRLHEENTAAKEPAPSA